MRTGRKPHRDPKCSPARHLRIARRGYTGLEKLKTVPTSAAVFKPESFPLYSAIGAVPFIEKPRIFGNSGHRRIALMCETANWMKSACRRMHVHPICVKSLAK